MRYSFKKNTESTPEALKVFEELGHGDGQNKVPVASIQINQSMSKSLQDCQSHLPSSPRKQRKKVNTVNEIVPAHTDLIKIDQFVSNLEKLDVKTKIKLMESFVATNPIPIGKSNERSASTSSTGSTASSTSSSSSKSPTISPK